MSHQKKSILSAVVIFIGLALWMASGYFGGEQGSVHASIDSGETDDSSPLTSAEQQSDPSVIPVVVETSYAHWIEPEVEIYARSEPLQTATVSSILAGIVETVSMQPGQLVSEGDTLVELSLATRPSRLREAQAWVKKRSADLDAARKMKDKGYQSEAEFQGIVAALESAKRELADIKLEIHLSTMRAPFSGVVESRSAEPGEVIAAGKVLGQIVRQDKYLLVANVPESQVALFSVGQIATARLGSGEMVSGTVRFIATQANSQTRSYRLEVVVDNPQERFVGGATAKLLLKRQKVQVHRVPSNVVTLDEDGTLGVKTVNADNYVEFWPIDISQSQSQTLLVQGMPEATQLIVSGQGFVRAGDMVKVTVADRDEEKPTL